MAARLRLYGDLHRGRLIEAEREHGSCLRRLAEAWPVSGVEDLPTLKIVLLALTAEIVGFVAGGGCARSGVGGRALKVAVTV
jgi:hypothetical protein